MLHSIYPSHNASSMRFKMNTDMVDLQHQLYGKYLSPQWFEPPVRRWVILLSQY